MTTKTITVDVDVDLDDFDDDDIREEAEDRGLLVRGGDDIVAMYYAFYFGKTEQALELARKVASDHVGRFLP